MKYDNTNITERGAGRLYLLVMGRDKAVQFVTFGPQPDKEKHLWLALQITILLLYHQFTIQ